MYHYKAVKQSERDENTSLYPHYHGNTLRPAATFALPEQSLPVAVSI